MKRLLLLAATTFLVACGGPAHMVRQESCPDMTTIKPPAGKAQLVIGRSTMVGGAVNFSHYVDRNFIGSTKGYGFFSTSLEPGDHYIAGLAENTDLLLMRFEQDKTYFVADRVRMGVMKARVKLDPTTGEALKKDMDGRCDFYVRDSSAVEPMNEKEWAEEIKDYGVTTPVNATPAP